MRDSFEVVILAPPARQRDVETTVMLAGGRVAATLGWNEAETLIDRQLGHPVLMIEAEGINDEVLMAALPHIVSVVDVLGSHLVVTLGRAQIDLFAGTLMGTGVELLCEPTTGQQVAALAVAGRRGARIGLSDGVREGDGESDRILRLTDEVARIADLLMRVAEGERGLTGAARDASDGQRTTFSFGAPAGDADPHAVRQAIRARRLRDSFFGDGLFEDPAWDMLLDLYAAFLEGTRVSVSSLCIAAAVAPTTALRWIGRMTDARLFERQPDPLDRRRAFMALSATGLAGMQGYVAAARRAGLPIA